MKKILLSLATITFFTSLTAAQPITGSRGGFIGTITGSYFDLSASNAMILADVVTFFLIWITMYAVLAIIIKAAANRSPGNAGDTLKGVLFGSGGGPYSHGGGRNLLIWISLFMLLSMGPYLGPLINDIQAQVMLAAGAGYIFGVIALLAVIVMGALYLTGLIGQGLGRGGNMAASGAQDLWQSDPVQAGRSAASNAVNRFRSFASMNTHIQSAGNLLRGGMKKAGQTQKKCPQCGTVQDIDNDTCTNCTHSFFI
ncbi:MAG: hypothetical protein SVS85_03980 [Candidatus Nanohaloarchaea archaeon]|nr:hypothetical protein [Candidatus Nanohaloarchaea archaeon]